MMRSFEPWACKARRYGRGQLLSPREREVIDLMAQGLTNKEIAQRTLHFAGHREGLRGHSFKLRARTRAQAVARYAAEEANDGMAQ